MKGRTEIENQYLFQKLDLTFETNNSAHAVKR